MWDSFRSMFLGQRSVRTSREQARPGVQLLASVLVCFPEIEAVSSFAHSCHPQRRRRLPRFLVRALRAFMRSRGVL